MSIFKTLLIAGIDIEDLPVKRWKKLSAEARNHLAEVIRDLALSPHELKQLRKAMHDDATIFTAYQVAEDRKIQRKAKKS